MFSDETIKESAKAVQEIAMTTGHLVELAGKVGGFVSKVVGKPAEQIGGILEDQIRFYRYKNLSVIGDKVEAIHRKRKIEGKTIEIPPRLAIPMLESAALEEDETLQDIWARLIANSTDPNFKTALHPGFIEIAKQLSPDEAIILNSFIKSNSFPVIVLNHVNPQYSKNAERRAVGMFWNKKETVNLYVKIYEIYEQLCQQLKLKQASNSRVYCDNLVRLQIAELGYDFSVKNNELYRYAVVGQEPAETRAILIPARDEYLRITTFGQNFIAACIADTD